MQYLNWDGVMQLAMEDVCDGLVLDADRRPHLLLTRMKEMLVNQGG